MDNKFLLALVWIVGAAVVATLVYSTCDLLRWLMARLVSGWQGLGLGRGPHGAGTHKSAHRPTQDPATVRISM